MATALYIKGQETGAKLADEEFFASDVVTGNIVGRGLDLIVEIMITVGVTPDIEITYDGGATWAVLIPTLALNTITRVRTIGIGTDLVNFRSSANCTLNRFLVIGDPDA
jgi:hypothetical protein